MEDLIKRLEAATGPSRELDVLCAFAAGEYPGVKDDDRERLALEWSAPRGFKDDDTGPITFTSTFADQWGIPNYTASIDAALTLVPDCPPESRKHFERNWWWRLEAFGGAKGSGSDIYVAGVNTFGVVDVRGYGKTPAIALTAAALKARPPYTEI